MVVVILTYKIAIIIGTRFIRKVNGIKDTELIPVYKTWKEENNLVFQT